MLSKYNGKNSGVGGSGVSKQQLDNSMNCFSEMPSTVPVNDEENESECDSDRDDELEKMMLKQKLAKLNAKRRRPTGSMPKSSLDISRKIQIIEQDSAPIQHSANGKRECIDIHTNSLKPFNSVLTPFLTQELRADYNTLCSMTLIDDIVIMNHLYRCSVTSMYREIYSNLIQECYKHKYESLFEKYPSVEEYVSIIVNFLVYNQFSCFVRACGTSNTKMLKCGNLSSSSIFGITNIMNGKRQSASLLFNSATSKGTGGGSNDTTTNTNDSILKDHPFLKCESYLHHTQLFDLGKILTQYCLPSEFAAFAVKCAPGKCTKYVRRGEKEYWNGVKINFNIPIMATLKPRLASKGQETYNYVDLESFGHLGEILEEYTGQTVRSFSYGVKTSMMIACVTDTSKCEPCDSKEPFSKGYYVTFVTNFDAIATDANELGVKCYSNKVYMMKESENQLDPDVVNKIENDERVKQTVETLKGHLREYKRRYNIYTGDDDSDAE